MLVAWHKLSRYERAHVCLKLDLEPAKVPFLTIGPVLKRLYHVSYSERYSTDEPMFPYQGVIKKIERAAIKQYKNRRRVRVKLEV